jgi:DNA polymerase-3 subunit epsilon
MQRTKTSWVLDTETTGFDPKTGDRIVEIGAIEIDQAKRKTGREFHEYVDPEREIPEAAKNVHGLDRDLCIQYGGGQKFKDIAAPLYRLIYGHEVIIHNADFDTRFLDHEFELLNKAGFKFKLNPADQEYSTFKPLAEVCTVTCSLKIAHVKHAGQRNNLDILLKRYGIPNDDREFHGALLDSNLLLQVWVLLTQKQNSLEFKGAALDQDVDKLADRITTKFELPMYSSDLADEVEHHKIMGRVGKESGGNAIWQI